jgi:hypothetical protein
MLFQPEAPCDSKGETAGTAATGESTHVGEDVDAQAQIDPQWEGAKAVVEIDKTDVWGWSVASLGVIFCKKYFDPAEASHVLRNAMGLFNYLSAYPDKIECESGKDITILVEELQELRLLSWTHVGADADGSVRYHGI